MKKLSELLKLECNCDKKTLRQEISMGEELQNTDDLIAEIEKYKKMEAEIDEKKKAIEDELTEIRKLETSNKNSYNMIFKFMERFNISQQEASEWVADLEEVLQYKQLRPDYKEVYEEALNKLNKQTQKVLEEIVEQQLEAKKVATKLQLTIKKIDEGVFDGVKKLFSNLKSLFKTFKDFGNIVKKLPKIRK